MKLEEIDQPNDVIPEITQSELMRNQLKNFLLATGSEKFYQPAVTKKSTAFYTSWKNTKPNLIRWGSWTDLISRKKSPIELFLNE